MPDIRLLRYFIAVAEELHFGRAADRLFISQPVLSRQIRELEHEVGSELVIRTKRVIRLTDSGIVLLEYARRIVADAEQALEAVKRAETGQVGVLRIGYVPSSTNSVLPEIVARFRREFPDVTLLLEELHNEQEVEAVRLLDFWITRPSALGAKHHRELLFSEPYVAVVPADHRLASEAALTLEQLAAEPFIFVARQARTSRYDYLIAACRGAGFSPRIVQEVSSHQALLGFVAAGLGVAVTASSNQSLRRVGVVFVPLAGLEASLAICWSNAKLSPAANKFLELARACGKGAAWNRALLAERG